MKKISARDLIVLIFRIVFSVPCNYILNFFLHCSLKDSDVLVYSAVCRMPFPIIYKLNPKDGSCDVITMDWLVNPEMLSSSVQSRRRRRQRDWSDSPMKKSDHSDTFLLDENNSAQQSSPEEKHVSEVDYDDMGFAPIRRQLPPISGGKSGTASGGRSNGDGGGSGAAMLSSLRAFANKEALHPGSGVRLFVQSCVLAGCDYIPNRLSKVGPVTAFKLVKETSHRDPGVRFQRVLKSLPKGSRLLAEAISDKRSEDGDVDDDELEDDFSSPPCSDSEAKEKYEELLSKSEAIFYYHLVQTICDGKIVPLVSHKPTDLRSSDAKSLPSDFFPCTKRFDPGLPFVGSIEEALKKLSETELSIVENSSFFPARQGNNGWMSTTSRNGPVANVYKKPPIQKETRLQSFLKAPSVRPKALFQNVSNNAMADIVKNVSSTNMIDKSISDRFIVKRKSPSRTPAHSTKHIAEKKKEWNPFAAFVRVATEADQNISKPMQSPDFANQAARKSAGKGMTSPLFSPGQSTDMFDYGDTPTNAEGTFKSRHFTGVDRSELQRDSESAKMDDESPVRDSSNSRSNDVQKMLKEIDIEKKKAEGRQHVSKESDLASGIEDSKFDYEIIPESPPLKSSSKGKAVASKYFQQLKSAHGLPQRISTSPPEHFREMARNDKMAGGSSPHDAIELLEDGEAEVVSATKENYPNCKQPKNLVPKTSSVNKRPFISPYFNSNKNNQSGTGLRKKLRTTASSAILAGFARQKEIETSVTSTSAWKKSSLSKCAGIATRKKPLPVAKRPKGTPSMMDFMMPSDKEH